MQCAERSPLSLLPQADPARVVLGPQAWAALVRAHPALQPDARVVEASLAHLGACGIDRYELKVRIVDARGMLDDRIWLVERRELHALVAALGDDAQSAALARLMQAGSRPAS